MKIEYESSDSSEEPEAKRARIEPEPQCNFSPEELHKQRANLTQVLISHGTSLEFLTTSKFQNFISNYKKGFKLPETNDEVVEIIKEEAEKCRERIKSLLKSRKSELCLNLFSFMSEYDVSGVGIIAHFFDKDYKLHRLLLKFEICDFYDPSDELYKDLVNITEQYELDMKSIRYIIIDDYFAEIRSELEDPDAYESLFSEKEIHYFADFVTESMPSMFSAQHCSYGEHITITNEERSKLDEEFKKITCIKQKEMQRYKI
ncbi:hypothetical protein FO519_006442 [Halicephalobus sp. NKZ332]|nr:hypothetical protein FO519_006442 [Halicephalobus sp. NKZ332]